MKIIDINGKERECEDAYLDKSWPGYVTVKFISKNRKGYSHTEWYPIDKFILNNPNLEYIVKGKIATNNPQEEIAGEVSASGKNTLRDVTASWAKNAYAGFQVWIARGKGEGQVRTILSNTEKTLKTDKDWDTKPDKTSQYAIVREVINTTPQGNTLAIAELKKLEKKAREYDIRRGATPASKQYT